MRLYIRLCVFPTFRMIIKILCSFAKIFRQHVPPLLRLYQLIYSTNLKAHQLHLSKVPSHLQTHPKPFSFPNVRPLPSSVKTSPTSECPQPPATPSTRPHRTHQRTTLRQGWSHTADDPHHLGPITTWYFRHTLLE